MGGQAIFLMEGEFAATLVDHHDARSLQVTRKRDPDE